MRGILELITKEIERARFLHGPLTSDHFRALAILSEEHGEVAKAILECRRKHWSKEARDLLLAELIQLASVTLLMILNLRDEGKCDV